MPKLGPACRELASNNVLMLVLKDVVSKLKNQGKIVGELATSVKNLHEKVDRVEKNQKQQEKVLEKLVGDRVVSVAVWCSFCRVATHPLVECRSRKECDMFSRFPQTTCVPTQGTGMHGVWRL